MEYDFLVTPDDPPAIIGMENRPATISQFTPRMFVKDVGKAYTELGGLNWLIDQATAAPAEFMKLLQKMMPKQVDIDLMEGTTIKLIDQFGQSIEVSGAAPQQLKSSTPPGQDVKVAEESLQIETATGVSPDHPAEQPIIDIKETY